jgi:hypothetical protein
MNYAFSETGNSHNFPLKAHNYKNIIKIEEKLLNGCFQISGKDKRGG